MQTNCNRQHFNGIALQGGVMPSDWLAINSLSYDRILELRPGSVRC
jgi:hypothetical protein